MVSRLPVLSQHVYRLSSPVLRMHPRVHLKLCLGFLIEIGLAFSHTYATVLALASMSVPLRQSRIYEICNLGRHDLLIIFIRQNPVWRARYMQVPK